MARIQETTLEIDLLKLEQNFNFVKSHLSNNTKILAVVKAFAYGSDAEVVANHLQDLNVDYFAVAYTAEGIRLRNAGISKPILVLHPQSVNFKTLIEHHLEPNLYNERVLCQFITVATELKQHNYPIHIKFNTGLNRLGFQKEEITTIVGYINATDAVTVTSIFSHLAASEDLNEKEFTLNQIAAFKAIKAKFEQLTTDKPFAHLTNTSGTLNYPEAHFDMVRTGIGLYGFGNDPRFKEELQPIASLKSIISQKHQLKVGDTLGYNMAFTATTPTTTATIPIGHADGITRQFGNRKGYVIINDQKADIIGNVCMDMIMVDITNIDCNEGDEVIIYDGKYTAADLGASAGTISYEVITSASQRIKRIFRR